MQRVFQVTRRVSLKTHQISDVTASGFRGCVREFFKSSFFESLGRGRKGREVPERFPCKVLSISGGRNVCRRGRDQRFVGTTPRTN